MLIKRNFYRKNTVKVAQDLLGCFLVRKYRGKITKAMIIETEAYRGEHDLASHASKGRTPRTEIMYGNPGHAYIYMIYGMYHMLNVVTEEKDYPAAVLIRGIEGYYGPGKLTKFLHIDKSLNSWDLTKGEKLWIEKGLKIKNSKIKNSKRIGVDYAKHSKEWKWNFRLTKW